MTIVCQDRILLTGAGFTKNFGAPLAREMWGIILGHPALDEVPGVREILLKDFDFESAYNTVMRGVRLPLGQDDAQERQAMRKAVDDAYEYIDLKIRSFSFRTDAPNPVNLYGVQDFLASFVGSSHKPGFFFTLNQDLFVERHYNRQRPTLPGIRHQPSWFTGEATQPLNGERCVVPQEPRELSELFDGSPFYYVKLHGSSNWYNADHKTIVIGNAKQAQIESEPLLAWYLNIFRSVLAGSGRRLLCIGYSFSDPHINSAIREGIRAGLRLYTLSPESPESLADRLRKTEVGTAIWRGLTGYFQFDLKGVFPADQTKTAEWTMVRRRFFGEC